MNTRLDKHIQVALSNLFTIERDPELPLQQKEEKYLDSINLRIELPPPNTSVPLSDKLNGVKQIPYWYSVCTFFWYDAKSNEPLESQFAVV
jgi:hypothetical protein